MCYVLVLLSVLSRFIPHIPNFSPLFAALLFGGAHLKSRDAVWYPLWLLATSDILLTRFVYETKIGWGQGITWVAFVVVVVIGYWLRNRETIKSFRQAREGNLNFLDLNVLGLHKAVGAQRGKARPGNRSGV